MKSMKDALKKSVNQESKALETRFSKADKILGNAKQKTEPAKKEKVIRDTFSLPESEHSLLADLSDKALQLGIKTNKSELVRAGLKVLDGMSDAQLRKTLKAVEKIKTGRPKG